MTAVALIACSAAGADPAAPAAHPAGWKQLAPIATAVGAAAKADGVVVDAVDAWGDPAAGCYAIWLTLHGGAGDAPALADQVLDGIASAPAAGSTRADASAPTVGLARASAPAASAPSAASGSSTRGAAGSGSGASVTPSAPATGSPAATGSAQAPGSSTRSSVGAIVVTDVVKPSGPTGVLAFAFARAPYRGRVRAQLGAGRIAAIACFANAREPAGCEAACAPVLQGVP